MSSAILGIKLRGMCQWVKIIEIKSSTNFSAVKSTSDVKKVEFLNLGKNSGDYMDTQNQAKKVILHGVRGNRIEAKVTPKKSSLAQVKCNIRYKN